MDNNKQRKSKKRKARTALIVIVVVLLVGTAGFFGYRLISAVNSYNAAEEHYEEIRQMIEDDPHVICLSTCMTERYSTNRLVDLLVRI